MDLDEDIRSDIGRLFIKASLRHDVSHGAQETLWNFMLKYCARLAQNLAKKKSVSYKTLRRDAEADMPKILLNIVRISSEGQPTLESNVTSIKQKSDLRKNMVTAFVKVWIHNCFIVAYYVECIVCDLFFFCF